MNILNFINQVCYLCRCPARRQTPGFCKPLRPETSSLYKEETVWRGAGLLQEADQ